MKKYFVCFYSFIFLAVFQEGIMAQIPDPIWGFTVETVKNQQQLNDIAASFQNFEDALNFKPTARIVFAPDGLNPFTPNPQDYEDIVSTIDNTAYIMGQFVDSYYWTSGNWSNCIDGYDFDLTTYSDRVSAFANDTILGQKVDIWEVGNEINAPWVNNGDVADTRYIVAVNTQVIKDMGYKTALTLYYYPSVDCVDDCNKEPNTYSNSEYMMLRWAEQLIKEYPGIEEELDYIFISYYEDANSWGCHKIKEIDWVEVFEDLHDIFPYSKLGFGEVGYSGAPPAQQEIFDIIDEFYGQGAPLTNLTYFTRGYFWWTYVDDCIPSPNNVYWNRIYDNIDAQRRPAPVLQEKKDVITSSNYPNPFNPSTNIKYYIPESSDVRITVYDVTGKKVAVLLDEFRNAGSHSVVFDGKDLASGIYFYRLEAGEYTETKKMNLVK